MDDARREYLKKTANTDILLYGDDASYSGEIDAVEVLRWLAIEAELVEVKAQLHEAQRGRWSLY